MLYRSNGKLLLTGEYLALLGAKALALPTNLGQTLNVSEGKNQVTWETFVQDKNYFQAEFDFLGHPKEPIEGKFGASLKIIFTSILKQKGDSFLSEKGAIKLTSNIEFPVDWGLGSSSTLIHNLATWAECDPFKILEDTIGGSGYDLACAGSNLPILYNLKEGKPAWENVDFFPEFQSELHFIHLNRKQDSRSAIVDFKERISKIQDADVCRISEITESLIKCGDIFEFSALLDEHESILSKILDRPTVKDLNFSDFGGTIKSLGAWGGDFVLAVGKESEMKYFSDKGFETIISYADMIKQKNKDHEPSSN